MTNNEFIEKAKAKAEECWSELIFKHCNHPKIYSIMSLYPSIPIYFDLKGMRAGTASVRSGSLFARFNLGFVANNGEKMLNRTVPHEIAHLFNFALSIVNNEGAWPVPHGRRWKDLMYMLGADSSRCNDYSIENVATALNNRPWKYTCSCGKTFHFTTRRHNSIRSGKIYSCKRCKGTLIKL